MYKIPNFATSFYINTTHAMRVQISHHVHMPWCRQSWCAYTRKFIIIYWNESIQCFLGYRLKDLDRSDLIINNTFSLCTDYQRFDPCMLQSLAQRSIISTYINGLSQFHTQCITCANVYSVYFTIFIQICIQFCTVTLQSS